MSIRAAARGAMRAAYERLPEASRDNLRRRKLELGGLGQLKANQALLAMRLARLELEQAGSPPPPDQVADPRFPDGVRSKLCTQSQLSEPWFPKWCSAFGEVPYAHRKAWEFAYIAECLDALYMLRPGRIGLGFGVGTEPLISAFASRGVRLLATDIDSDAKEALGWVRSDQHASGVEGMLRPGVCDPDEFRRLVSWSAVDMRAIPVELTGFDFCWSACALEHLGTLDAGLDFIEHSIATLKPGGIAVHTTEFNLSSDTHTIENGPTVVYRKRDVLALKQRLESAGHEVAAFDFSRGDGLLDHYVDVPPYADEPVLRFLAGAYVLTSIAFVIRARPV